LTRKGYHNRKPNAPEELGRQSSAFGCRFYPRRLFTRRLRACGPRSRR
jgi:hypothetical protein